MVLLALSSAALARPELSGPEEIVDDGLVALHFTREGDDAPPADDADEDGVPDVVERIHTAIRYGVDTYAAEGWNTVPPDDDLGGSDSMDVYVRHLDINGYAHGERGGTCYMEVDPAVAQAIGLALESVAVHELHHCVEFTYTDRAPSWVYEATATYEQYRLVPDDPTLELALGVLWAVRITAPTEPIDETGDRLEYAQFILMKYLADRGDGVPMIRQLWQELAVGADAIAALDRLTRDRLSVPFEAEFGRHALWNSFACARDDGRHYDSAELGCTVEAEAPIEPMELGSAVSISLPGDFAYKVFELPPIEGALSVTIDCQSDDLMVLAAEALTADPEPIERSTSSDATGASTVQITETADASGYRIAIVAPEGPIEATCTASARLPEQPKKCGVLPLGDAPAAAILMVLALVRARWVSSRPTPGNE